MTKPGHNSQAGQGRAEGFAHPSEGVEGPGEGSAAGGGVPYTCVPFWDIAKAMGDNRIYQPGEAHLAARALKRKAWAVLIIWTLAAILIGIIIGAQL